MHCEKTVKRQYRQWTRSLEAALATSGPDQLTPVQIGYWLSPPGRAEKKAILRAYWCREAS